MWIGNLLLVLLNLPLIGIWVSLLKVPYRFLFPAIMAFSVVGIYSTNNRPFDLFLLVIFGVLGVIWRILECSPVPLMLGRSEEHKSELQSLMRISYAVF